MNGTVCAVLTSLTKRAIALNDQILCNGTLHAVGKISVKTQNVLIKNGVYL